MSKNSFRPLRTENSDFLPEEPLGESLLSDNTLSVRVWRPKSTVIVLGRSQKAENEINLQTSQADSIPIFQRMGGGGCVVLDENSICLALRYERDGNMNVTHFLEHSTKGVQLFLQESYGLSVEIKENYDLLLNGRKFLGSSLYMPKGFCLYLAVILMKPEALIKINKYLTMPSKQPSHRQGKTHDDFLVPLLSHLDNKVTMESFRVDLEQFMIETEWTKL